MPLSRCKQLTSRGAVGKTTVVGVKDRGTREFWAEEVVLTDGSTL